MPDVNSILIANLSEAFKQLNAYIGLGIATAISALALDRRLPHGPESSSPVAISGIPVPMSPDAAKWVLVGVSFVVGAMASYAAKSAVDTATRLLKTNAELLEAVCTFPSLATAPIGARLLATALPVIFVVPIMWRAWSRIRAQRLNEGWAGLITLAWVFLAPYAALGLLLFHLPCAS